MSSWGGWPIISWPPSASGSASVTTQVPPALAQAAAEREFPVFEVPYEVPFIAVTEAAFTQLVNEQYAVLRRALAAHERLERVVLSERGLDALAGTLATLIGAAVLVFDARGEPLVQRAFRRTLEPDEVSALQTELCERRRLRPARSCHRIRGWPTGRWRCRWRPTGGRAEPSPGATPEASACRRRGWWRSRTAAAPCLISTA